MTRGQYGGATSFLLRSRGPNERVGEAPGKMLSRPVVESSPRLKGYAVEDDKSLVGFTNATHCDISKNPVGRPIKYG